MREFGSEHPAIVLPDGYFDSLGELGREVTYLRCGREALMFVGMQMGEKKVILFPSYCCWSMSAPFEKLGWKVVYYRLNKDLTIDLEYLKNLLDFEKPDAVLTMNFYGSADTREAVSIIKSTHPCIAVIEDFSHCTFNIRQIWNNQVDYYVSSIRKSIGLCDGAVVLSREVCDKSYIQSERADFSDNRYVAQISKGHYSWCKDQEEKQSFLTAIRECEGIINGFDSVHPISERAAKMLQLVSGEEIAYARRENMKHLWTRLNGLVEMVPGLERCFDGAPFSLPILVDDRDQVQAALARQGVYSQLLWPVCQEAQHVCKVSKMMNDRMLSIPIDQRLTWDDIEDIATIIIETICKKNY